MSSAVCARATTTAAAVAVLCLTLCPPAWGGVSYAARENAPQLGAFPVLANGTDLAKADPRALLRQHCEQNANDFNQTYNDCLDALSDFYPHAGVQALQFDLNKLYAQVYLPQGKGFINGTYSEVRKALTALQKTYPQVVLAAHGLNSNPASMGPVLSRLPAADGMVLINIDYSFYVDHTLAYLSFVHKVGQHCRLIKEHLLDPVVGPATNLTLIGHSLGGQTVGVLGNILSSKEFNRPPNYVIGLDAAGPIFTTLPAAWRFNENSGLRVISIHTSVVLGIWQTNGLVDVYVNNVLARYKECDDTVLDIQFTCNHVKALYVGGELIEASAADAPLHQLQSDDGILFGFRGFKDLLDDVPPGSYRTTTELGQGGNSMHLFPLRR